MRCDWQVRQSYAYHLSGGAISSVKISKNFKLNPYTVNILQMRWMIKASYKKSNCVSLTFIIPRGLISKLQETKISRVATEKGTYGLLTKCGKKIVAAILTEQVWSIKDLLYGKKILFFFGTQRVIPSEQKKRNLPRSRNQSQYRIGFTLRAQEAGHITINNTA